jgi:hypothetical protein
MFEECSRRETTKFRITHCVKCGTALEGPDPEARGGRPSRFCSQGCKVSAEAEMRRVNVLLRKFEEGRAVDMLNGRVFRAARRSSPSCRHGSTTWPACPGQSPGNERARDGAG